MPKRDNISMSVIRRLPRYYRFLSELKDNGVVRISSRELSDKMGFTASQIRQDLNCFGGFGQQGYGYYVHLSQPQKAYRMVIKIRSSGGQGYIRVNATDSPSQGKQVAQFEFDDSGTTEVKFDKSVETQDIMLWVPLDSLPGNQLYIESIQVF